MNYISVFKEVWFLENSLQCMKYFFAFKIKINRDFRKFYMVRSLFLLLENLFSVYGVILCWFLLYMIFSDNNTRSHFIKKLQHFWSSKSSKISLQWFSCTWRKAGSCKCVWWISIMREGQNHADSNLWIMCEFYFNRRRIKDASWNRIWIFMNSSFNFLLNE